MGREKDFDDYKEKYENSLRKPSVPVEDTALGKEVKKYYEEKTEEV